MNNQKREDIRKFPEQETRVETGPIQFGEDWPGVFIRGDNAGYYAMELNSLLESLKNSELHYNRIALRGLLQALNSCMIK